MSDDKPSKLWGAADAYERYMGRWSRKIAPLFVDWLAAQQGKKWLDIGCGTGQLSLQIASKCNPSHHIGIDQAEGFLALAKKNVPSAEFRVGDAQNIDLSDDAVDYTVSGLLLNFIPDKAKALSEMVRIVRPGGAVALYVWDYAGQMQIMRYFFDAARVIDPKSSAFDDGITHRSADQRLFPKHLLPLAYPMSRQPQSTSPLLLLIFKIIGSRSWAEPVPLPNTACRLMKTLETKSEMRCEQSCRPGLMEKYYWRSELGR